MLYSREFLEAGRDRLRPGGVYAQWFHQYETSPEAMRLVLATFADVFEHVAVWYTQRADLLILGLTDPARRARSRPPGGDARRGPTCARRSHARASTICPRCWPTNSCRWTW